MAAVNVNMLKTYIKRNFNILLEGPHGVGKTQMLTEACAELGWKVKYFSASTLDPFTDLVGIPVPEDRGSYKDLVNIRPHDIDSAEILFFDELNRAEPKTLNALMEIIQFKRINGEPLPNLKAVVGAMNPPEDEYQVNTLDPALVDRFMFVIPVDAKPDRGYLRSAFAKAVSPVTSKPFGQERADKVADALIEWHKDLDKMVDSKHTAYVSPRKLEHIGLMFMTLQDDKIGTRIQDALIHALPPGNEWHHGELYALLGGDASLNPDNSDYDFTNADGKFLRERADVDTVVDWIVKNPDDADAVLTKIAAEKINKSAQKWGKLFDAMTEDQWKHFVSGYSETKRNIFVEIIKTTDSSAGISEDAKTRIEEWTKSL